MKASRKRSLVYFLLLLFGLSTPCWLLGAVYDVQIFPGFKLFQLPLAMPMVAALILRFRENGKTGVLTLLKRTYDFQNFKPRIWFLPILLIYPSIGLVDCWILHLSGTRIPPLHFSFTVFLSYSTIFFMTYGEELGLTGYAIDPMLQRFSALKSGLLLGLVWAGYHIPGFIISRYYSFGWIFWHALYTAATRVLFVWVYNNSGKSLFSMALFHWTFGLFWSLWPQDNLQRSVPFYDPRICALLAIFYVAVVAFLWGPKTLKKYRFA
jgi:membrane protease YdiL (CAAX protease family)